MGRFAGLGRVGNARRSENVSALGQLREKVTACRLLAEASGVKYDSSQLRDCEKLAEDAQASAAERELRVLELSAALATARRALVRACGETAPFIKMVLSDIDAVLTGGKGQQC